MLWFFRDPERTPDGPGLVSPADGKVVRLDTTTDADGKTWSRIAVFLSPLDVHVNRWPIGGQLEDLTYKAGGHVPAFRKDSDRNERLVARLATPHGAVRVTPIAGTVARRIVSYVDAPGPVTRGERFALIRFGSRCDVEVEPGAWEWVVRVGDTVRAGKTILAVEVPHGRS